MTLSSIKNQIVSRIQNNLVVSGIIFTFILYICGVILFAIKGEGVYFITQLFILLIFLSIGLTIFVTEYSLAHVKGINSDITRLVFTNEEIKKIGNIDLRVSWSKILPTSIIFGLVVDVYIYLTESRFFSVLNQIYLHVYDVPILYHYFLLVGFIAGFVGGRAVHLGFRYILYTIMISRSKVTIDKFRIIRVINKPRKVKEIHELMQIAFNISIGGLLVLGMAAYFILIAAQIVDPLSMAILVVAVTVVIAFFVIPQKLLSSIVRAVKENMFREVYSEYGLDADWFINKKKKGFEIVDASTWGKEESKMEEQLKKLNGLEKHEFHALTSHLDYIEEIQEWPLDYKWFIAEFAIALIPFLVVSLLSR
ncbi:MAG: hypothetical protein ACP5OC_00860 [Thermoplasmata archaeon]